MELYLLPRLIFIFLVTVNVAFTLQDFSSDMCDIISNSQKDENDEINPAAAEELEKHIYYSYLPKLGKAAGKFTRDHSSSDWTKCTMKCCQSAQCDVALFTLNKCFHVSCIRDPPDACAPELSTIPKHNSTVMVVRDVSWTKSRPEDLSTPQEKTPQEKTIDISSFSSPTSSSSSSLSSPTSANQDNEDDENDKVETGSKKKLSGEACTYGMYECTEHADCIKTNTRSRQGHCECGEGYTASDDGTCILEDGNDSSEQVTATEKKPTSPKPTEAPTPPPIEPMSADHILNVTKLTVSAGKNKTIQLPEDTVSLSALVLPESKPGETYSYEWTPESIPENAQTAIMDGKNTATLKLSKLIAGLYVLRIKVTGENKFGEAVINVTVLPPKRHNQPPKVIIKPDYQTVVLPNSAILDGSDSTDDDQIVAWKWEEVSGPLQDHELNTEGPMLTLKDMAPGNYTFRLTVTDSDGASNSTSANVTIQKEKDYPPLADAGSDQVIYLPQNTLTLSGNRSTDDKKIVSYEWTQSTDKTFKDLPVGMTGVRTPFLHLENLEVGDYKFTLKVTDSSGQTDSADVMVFVKAQNNHPPKAKTAGQVTLFLPLDSLTLDGSNSTDDLGKMEYSWTQQGGPTTLSITNNNQAIAFATGKIQKGKYEFTLLVKDGELQQSSANLVILVKKDVNLPPVARAGGDKVYQLPVTIVTLNGSKSTDDHGIVKYTWTRDSKSLAAGTVVNQSDHNAILQLINMVTGQYMFILTVEDREGLSSSDTATVQIKPNDHQKDFVEIILEANIEHFTLANKQSIQDQLELLLQKSSEDRDTRVQFVSIQEDVSTGHTVLTFQVLTKNEKDQTEVMEGLKALKTLRSKLDSGKILDYSIVRMDLSVCQNNCSGHGHCDQSTKQCVCEAFWMPNFFTSTVFTTESNCDWSVLYVVIICFIIVVAIVSSLWALFCCCSAKRCYSLKMKTRRRHRYSLLRDRDEDSVKDDMELSKGKIQNSSVMISESDFSSDEETLFISNKKSSNGNANGKVSNGSTKKAKTKS